MIAVSEAKKIIINSCKTLPPITVRLEEAAGHVLADDVIALYDIPGFAQSSMDGYAFAFDGYTPGAPLLIQGERAAGPASALRLASGHACRIFTGAALPDGADTVVMQEKTTRGADLLTINDTMIAKGQFVRAIGAEVNRGGFLLQAGTYLGAPAISYLAATGITEVHVYPFPVVSVIVTGNEFQPRGEAPAYGLVFESNSLGLKAALKEIGIDKVQIFYVGDSLEATSDVLRDALAISDLVLLTGGVSVGEYDFVVAAATACAVVPGFHKVKQKPGKPLFFGMKGRIPVFGLPGNPSSVLTCYYEYVLPAIEGLCRLPVGLKHVTAKMAQAVTKPTGLTHFMKAVCEGDSVRFLNAQESFRLSSFATANCLLVLGESDTTVAAGEVVEIHLLP